MVNVRWRRRLGWEVTDSVNTFVDGVMSWVMTLSTCSLFGTQFHTDSQFWCTRHDVSPLRTQDVELMFWVMRLSRSVGFEWKWDSDWLFSFFLVCTTPSHRMSVGSQSRKNQSSRRSTWQDAPVHKRVKTKTRFVPCERLTFPETHSSMLTAHALLKLERILLTQHATCTHSIVLGHLCLAYFL